MSIMICSDCERHIDTDFHEMYDVNGDGKAHICGRCLDNREFECWGCGQFTDRTEQYTVEVAIDADEDEDTNQVEIIYQEQELCPECHEKTEQEGRIK